MTVTAFPECRDYLAKPGLSAGGFKDILLADRALIKPYFDRFPQRLSQYTFSTMYTWNQGKYRYQYKIEDDLLLISIRPRDKDVLYLFKPIGEIRHCCQLRDIVRREQVRSLAMVDETFIQEYAEKCLNDYVKVTPTPQYSDYYYVSEELAELKGRKFSAKRNLIKQFHEAYGVDDLRIVRIGDLSQPEMAKIVEEWCMFRGCDENEDLKREKIALMQAIQNFKELELDGIAVRADDGLLALSIFEQLNPDTAVIHFEKARPGIKGIYQYINQEAAKVLAGRYRFINRESDEGIEGLRQAKLSYHPVKIENAYSLSAKE